MKTLTNFHVPIYTSVQAVTTMAKNVQAAPSDEENCVRRKLITHDSIFCWYVSIISY